MIPVDRLLYKLDMKLNKLASNYHQSIPNTDKILALNEAQLKLIKQKLDINNNYRLGLDGFKKRYEDLQILVVPFEKLEIQLEDGVYRTYTGNIQNLSKEYFVPLEIYTTCSKGSCIERPVYISKIIKHGDISTLFANTHYIPSFEYQESFAQVTNNKIIVYTDGTFNIDELYISYLRYPQKINISGYVDFDGSDSTDSNCELPEYLEDELLNIAVLELAMNTENIPVVQFDQIRSKNNE